VYTIGCNLKAIKRVMDEDALSLEIIVNNKACWIILGINETRTD